MVLNAGELVEFGEPKVLLKTPDGALSALVRDMQGGAI
jgi:ABC-type multidrug transport system fused ATPase/permease subunit